MVAPGTANAGIVDEIENPNPAPGTNNWYTEDGYGGGSFGSASYGGGSYTDCADTTQPGVAPIVQLPAVAAAPDRSALRSRPLLPAEQLQPGLLRQRQQRLHRHQCRTTPCSRFRRRRRRSIGDSTARPPTSPGSTTATSGTTTCPTVPAQLRRDRAPTPTSTATSAIRSSTTPRSWPTRRSAPRISRTR